MDVNFRKDDLEECNTIDVVCWKWLSHCVNCIVQLAKHSAVFKQGKITAFPPLPYPLQAMSTQCCASVSLPRRRFWAWGARFSSWKTSSPKNACVGGYASVCSTYNVWNTGSLSFLLRVGDKTRRRFWTRITLLLVLSLHNYYDDVTVTWLLCEQRLFDLRRAASARRVWFLVYDRRHDQIFLRTENLCLNSDEITSLLILFHALFLCSYHSRT